MAFDWKKLNWTAIKIGILVTVIATFITLVLLPPAKGILGPIIGGFAAVYYAKTKDFKEVCMTGALAGGIGSAVYYFIITYVTNALFHFRYLTGLPFEITYSYSYPSSLVVIIGLVTGLILGAVGGLFKWFYHLK